MGLYNRFPSPAHHLHGERESLTDSPLSATRQGLDGIVAAWRAGCVEAVVLGGHAPVTIDSGESHHLYSIPREDQ